MPGSHSMRFPDSAALFQFCKEYLIFQKDCRVTDQDVGQLIHFEPADSTHWKHGRKNMCHVHYVNQISKNLNVDSQTISDILSGKKTWEECLKSYTTHIDMQCPISHKSHITKSAEKLISENHIESLPIYTSEIVALHPAIVLQRDNWEGYGNMKTYSQDGQYFIVQKESVREDTHLRFLTVLEFSKIFIQKQEYFLKLDPLLLDQYSRLLSLHLLMPNQLLTRALAQCGYTHDFVTFLSESFWVSRKLVLLRLQDFLTDTSSSNTFI